MPVVEFQMFHSILLAFAFGGLAFAADCFQNEQRDSDTPTGDQIGKALTPDLGSICTTTFKTSDDEKLQITYNHWSKTDTVDALLRMIADLSHRDFPQYPKTGQHDIITALPGRLQQHHQPVYSEWEFLGRCVVS
jgi:hypothetical protein